MMNCEKYRLKFVHECVMYSVYDNVVHEYSAREEVVSMMRYVHDEYSLYYDNVRRKFVSMTTCVGFACVSMHIVGQVFVFQRLRGISVCAVVVFQRDNLSSLREAQVV